jgi:hypothetical protein
MEGTNLSTIPVAGEVVFRQRGSKTYRREVTRLYRRLVPPGRRVLQIGLEHAGLLRELAPSHGLGLDTEPSYVEAAAGEHAGRENCVFRLAGLQHMDWAGEEPFDYILFPDVVSRMEDIQAALELVRPACHSRTRVILNYYNNVWRPVLEFAKALGLRRRRGDRNWLSTSDLRNLLHLADFDVITQDSRLLCPVGLPLLEPVCNRVLCKLPLLDQLSLGWYIVARPRPGALARTPHPPPAPEELTVSVLVPTRNERGNIEEAFTRTPAMGKWTELVFVDGNSTDGTIEEIRRCMEKYRERWPRARLIHQTGKGKGQAVRQGFDACEGDILMILDSDLTMPPEQLPKYFEAMASGKAEFINGCRLVYPKEDRAMRFFNMLANHAFALWCSWLLGQRVKDTLCGTKVLSRQDYRTIAANRSFFGKFDPFGDFDLLFGAAMIGLHIIDMPIRYRERTYGEIKIRRWHDGFLLLRMCLYAMWKRFLA